MNRRAIFRCDASTQIGGGHIFRCLTLAQALVDRGWTCTFVSTRGSAEVVPSLSEGKHRLVEIDNGQTASILPLEGLGDADLLVVDHYSLDAKFESACRTIADRIMVIDDIPGRSHDCDVLLDQTLGRRSEAYAQKMRRAEITMLLGPTFALLRPEFAALRPKALERKREKVERVLISFGATDVLGLCAPASQAAITEGIPRVDIALGSASPHFHAIRSLSRRFPQIHIHVNAEMAPLMAGADLAIGAAGTTSWERCCLGLPTLMVVVADNQLEIAAALDEAGAATIVDAVKGPQTLLSALQRIQNSPAATLMSMSLASREICDGTGAVRVANMLDHVCEREPT